MKITSKKYALALLDSVSGKDQNAIKNIIDNFVKVLVSNNDVGKADKIIEDFEDKWRRENDIVEAEVKSARILEPEVLKIVKNYLKKITKAEKIEIINEVDEKILGGVIIKYGDKILDNSIKTRLIDLKNNLSK